MKKSFQPVPSPIAFLIIAVCLFSVSLSKGQAPVKEWDARFGGSDEDQLYSIGQTADGGYILGGQSNSGISGDKTQANQGYWDYWIVKTDASGIKEWDARFGGSDYDELRSLQQTTDGGYILGGHSFSGISGDKTQSKRGGNDYWIVKTDANGVKQWDARFGGSGYDYLYSLQQTIDGGYILGGFSDSGISGDKTQPSQGDTDYWIVKTDGSGIKQWDSRFGGTHYDYLHCLRQTSDGGYILGGESLSGVGGDKTQASRGVLDYWIVKTDVNGVKQWDRRFGSSSSDNFSSLQQTTDGGYILGGHSWSEISGDKTEASEGVNDYWIVKTDANGLKQWDEQLGGDDYDHLVSLQQTPDGGYVLGGQSYSGISGDKTQASQGENDFWIVKIDSSGITQWDARFGGSSYDGAAFVDQTVDGGYILGGGSSSGISGDKTQPGQGDVDFWMVKTTSEITSITSLPILPDLLDVYPNPFTSSATIAFLLHQNSKVQVELYDVAGKKLQTLLNENRVAGNHSINLNGEQLSAGIYFIRLLINDEVMMKKVVTE